MGKIDVQSYRTHTEVLSFLILLKFRTSCGLVEDWGEKNIQKSFRHLNNTKQKRASVSVYYHYFVLRFPISSFAVFLVVGQRRLSCPSDLDY